MGSLNLKLIFYPIVFTLISFEISAIEYGDKKIEMPVLSRVDRLAARSYVSSTLNEIFGPAAKSSTYDYIFKQPTIFSGPCDVYEQIRTGHDKIHDIATSCFERNDTSILPLYGKSNLLRSGYMIKICLKLTNNDEALNFALRKAGILNADRTLLKKDLKSLYKLFYPFKNINSKSTLALDSLAGEYKGKKKWKVVLNLLCTDPAWTIL